jgi:hypothetical protein
MSKKEISYNIGDKFVITISEKYAPTGTESARQDSPDTLYRMNGFKSLVFDAEGLKKLKPYKPLDIEAIRGYAFYNGAREAWELACTIGKGEISSSDLREIFDTGLTTMIFASYSFTEAKDKFETFLAKKRAEEERARLEAIQSDGSQADGDDALKPGDVVRHKTSGEIGIVLAKPNGGLIGIVTMGGVHQAATFELEKV